MRRLIPTPSMAVALLALLVALSGSAYAVSKIGTNQIKNRAVTTPKIRNGAVTGPKIGNSAISGPKIQNGTLPASKMAPGVLSRGGGGNGPLLQLSGVNQLVVEETIRVEAGQTLMASAVVNMFQDGVGASTEARCSMFAAPIPLRSREPRGSLQIGMSPDGFLTLGLPGQDVQFPMVGHLDVSSSGLWSARLSCRKDGVADVWADGSSLVAWAVATSP